MPHAKLAGTAAVIWLVLAGSAGAAEPERVVFPSAGDRRIELTGYLYRPDRPAAKAPGIVALHGCGGLFDGKGRISSRHADWAERWRTAGYFVLMPDSLGSRGVGSVCNTRSRVVVPRGRADDAIGAAGWLASQPGVDGGRLALIGWSHGGSSALWTSGDLARAEAPPFRLVIAFYPGCRVPSESSYFRPRLKPHVLIGDIDDWTPVEPCRVLAERRQITLVEYPGAYHGFDAPNQPIRVRKGVAFSKNGDGIVHTGTNPAARAASISEVTRLLLEAFK